MSGRDVDAPGYVTQSLTHLSENTPLLAESDADTSILTPPFQTTSDKYGHWQLEPTVQKLHFNGKAMVSRLNQLLAR